MSDIILETRGLTKHYGGVHALDDANFVLHAGEHVAVVGDNGAGKSTFVRQITAVEQRQCVSIARTAAFASQLVIMDEPTTALGGRKPRRSKTSSGG